MKQTGSFLPSSSVGSMALPYTFPELPQLGCQRCFGADLASACSRGWSPCKPGMPYASRLLVHAFISAWKSQQMLVIQELLSAFGLKGLGPCPSSPTWCTQRLRLAEPPCKPCAPSSRSCEGRFSASADSSLPGRLGSRKPSSITSAEAESARFSFSADNIRLE